MDFTLVGRSESDPNRCQLSLSGVSESTTLRSVREFSFDHSDTFINRPQFLRSNLVASACADVLEGCHEFRPSISQRTRKRVAAQNVSKRLQRSPITPCVNKSLQCLKELLLIVHSSNDSNCC